MSFTPKQLQQWSLIGGLSRADLTGDSIKNALKGKLRLPSPGDSPVIFEYKIYLQGSYRNHTNIRGDSDVDVIVELTHPFESDVARENYGLANLRWIEYYLADFRSEVLRVLRQKFGSEIIEGAKAVVIQPSQNRLKADVLICITYRQYPHPIRPTEWTEGIVFLTQAENRMVVNYPKLHFEFGVKKNQECGELYKPLVRVFKNAKRFLVEQELLNTSVAPSYFIECLLSNVPNHLFTADVPGSFYRILSTLNREAISGFKCQNQQTSLFGNTPEQWDLDSAETFLNALRAY